MRDEIAPHVQDITRALGGKVSELEIEKELSNYVNVYRVSLDTAKRSIVKKHGGNPAHLSLGIAKSIQELVPGENSVDLLVRIVSVNEKSIDSENGARTILYGIFGDATATVPFTAWEPLPFEPARGDVVRVANAYVKSWRGIPQVSFDERALVKKLGDNELPPMDELGRSPRMWIEDRSARGGGVDVTVRGSLIDLKEGSGLVYRCPECKRVLRKGVCRIHGDVTGTPDLRVKAVLDDGSGALTAVFGKDLTEGLLDKTVEECIAQAKEAMSQEVIRDELADLLVAQPVEARGNVTSDDYGLMMIVDQAKILKVDVREEARAMLEELEGPA